ncbi:uncharacterized protein TM35_000751010 [Trypanosoma theileri]|uniref:Uncharacterized protein n=1 Tax=Trypanosoma theileri TaxID=67003 RepID=A0A1X0NF22_9TRYP|nr:uncharacterized protein TM35_000751010 [Trypanosoma theileri]ORC83334.1 hypothetical protein TM35_000751010 [Trypanosoma theileri]
MPYFSEFLQSLLNDPVGASHCDKVSRLTERLPSGLFKLGSGTLSTSAAAASKGEGFSFNGWRRHFPRVLNMLSVFPGWCSYLFLFLHLFSGRPYRNCPFLSSVGCVPRYPARNPFEPLFFGCGSETRENDTTCVQEAAFCH